MNSKKFVSLAVLCVMVMGVAPFAAIADDSGYYTGGYDGGGYYGGGYDDGGYFSGGYDGGYYGGYMDGGYLSGGYDGGYFEDDYDDYYQDDYGYGGGGSTGCYGCGGGYSIYPVVTQGARPSGGGSQSQSQSQSQVSNNTNTNTNVNVNNNTAIAVAQVQIGSQTASYTPPAPTYPTYPAPYCTIHQAQYGSYGYGTNQAYLSWTSTNAQSAYLSNYGSVSVNGSQTVYPSYTTTYTLTVYGYNGQQATCQTTVYANTYVPTTPYVSLTQIPYTGFDFGPVGNAMYWAALAIFAIGGAYLAVYYLPRLVSGKAGIPTLALSGSYKRSFAPVVAPKAPILVEREAAEAKVASIVESLRKSGTTDAMAIVHMKGSMPKIVVERA